MTSTTYRRAPAFSSIDELLSWSKRHGSKPPESLTYAELYDADCKHPSFTDVAFVGGV